MILACGAPLMGSAEKKTRKSCRHSRWTGRHAGRDTVSKCTVAARHGLRTHRQPACPGPAHRVRALARRLQLALQAGDPGGHEVQVVQEQPAALTHVAVQQRLSGLLLALPQADDGKPAVVHRLAHCAPKGRSTQMVSGRTSQKNAGLQQSSAAASSHRCGRRPRSGRWARSRGRARRRWGCRGSSPPAGRRARRAPG